MHKTFHANVLFYNDHMNANLEAEEASRPKLYDCYKWWIRSFVQFNDMCNSLRCCS